MLHDAPCKHETESLWTDGAYIEFSLAREETNVSMHAIHALLGLIPTSWETTVTFQTLVTFASREISFLTPSPSFQRQISPQGKRGH